MYKIFAKLFFQDKKTLNLPKCHSTNELCLDMFRSKLLNHGDIVITDWQSAGKGSRGTTWESPPGENLTFSIALLPQLPIESAHFLNMVTSLAVEKTVNEILQEEVFVKWPNDVYVRGSKIAGILIENKVNAGTIIQSVVGVGININQRQFDFEKATSLAKIANRTFDKLKILESFKNHFETYYNQYELGYLLLKREYEGKMYKKGELSLIREVETGATKWGIIEEVNIKGELVVRHGNLVTRYVVKELLLIR